MQQKRRPFMATPALFTPSDTNVRSTVFVLWSMESTTALKYLGPFAPLDPNSQSTIMPTNRCSFMWVGSGHISQKMWLLVLVCVCVVLRVSTACSHHATFNRSPP